MYIENDKLFGREEEFKALFNYLNLCGYEYPKSIIPRYYGFINNNKILFQIPFSSDEKDNEIVTTFFTLAREFINLQLEENKNECNN